jgi:hypothetical protein
MQKTSFKLLMTLSVMGLLLASSAFAQSPERIYVNIPFEFTVGSKTLPAGEYTVRQILPSRLLIQSRDARHGVIAMTHDVQAKAEPNKAQLLFARYGDQYFLYQVFAPGTSRGRELTRSDVEAKIAQTATARSVTLNGHP